MPCHFLQNIHKKIDCHWLSLIVYVVLARTATELDRKLNRTAVERQAASCSLRTWRQIFLLQLSNLRRVSKGSAWFNHNKRQISPQSQAHTHGHDLMTTAAKPIALLSAWFPILDEGVQVGWLSCKLDHKWSYTIVYEWDLDHEQNRGHNRPCQKLKNGTHIFASACHGRDSSCNLKGLLRISKRLDKPSACDTWLYIVYFVVYPKVSSHIPYVDSLLEDTFALQSANIL